MPDHSLLDQREVWTGTAGALIAPLEQKKNSESPAEPSGLAIRNRTKLSDPTQCQPAFRGGHAGPCTTTSRSGLPAETLMPPGAGSALESGHGLIFARATGIRRLNATSVAPLGATIALVSASALHPSRARAFSIAAAAPPGWQVWGAAGLTLLLLLLLLAIWQRDGLVVLLLDARQWLGDNLGGLVRPLRRRRHLIHDPVYLREIIQAEIDADPEHWQDEAQDTPAPLAGRRGARDGDRRSDRGRRRGSRD